MDRLELEVVYVTPDDGADDDDVTYGVEIAGETDNSDEHDFQP